MEDWRHHSCRSGELGESGEMTNALRSEGGEESGGERRGGEEIPQRWEGGGREGIGERNSRQAGR